MFQAINATQIKSLPCRDQSLPPRPHPAAGQKSVGPSQPMHSLQPCRSPPNLPQQKPPPPSPLSSSPTSTSTHSATPPSPSASTPLQPASGEPSSPLPQH